MSVTTIGTKNNLPEKVDRFINDLLPFLEDFLQERNVTFEVDETGDVDTFAFNPFTKKVLIGKELADKLENGEDGNNKLFFKMALFHELSHFRDLKVEQDYHGKSSMKSILLSMNNKKIEISDIEFLAIGESIHRLYNEIDDIVVNKEVEKFISSGIDKETFEYIYKTILFPYKDENGQIVMKGEIDYSEKPLSAQFSDFMLRSFMVPSQTIKLEEKLEKVLKAPNVLQTYKRTLALIENRKQNFSKDPEVKKRYEKVKHVLAGKTAYLQHFDILQFDKVLSDVYKQLRKYFPSIKPYLSWSIYDLLDFFTKTKGVDENHKLIIPPYLRYEILQKLFEPLQELFVLIDWIETGKLDDDKKGKGQGKGKGKNGEENTPNTSSGGQMEHDNMDIEEKIRLLDELENEERRKEMEKQAQTPLKELNNLFNENGVSDGTQSILARIGEKNNKYISELVKFFEEQLVSIEKQYIEKLEEARKGKLNSERVIREIEKDPLNPDLQKPIYDTIEIREEIEKDFKKMDFIFVIDVSGSMSFHKGSNGALSSIIYIFSQALMHLEQTLQNLLEDKEYKIDMNFILYGDNIGFSTLGNKKWGNLPSKVKFAKSFEEIQRLSGGTDDRVGWKKVSQELKDFLQSEKEYKQEVVSGKRRPVVLQIADSDVTEDGVLQVKQMLKGIGMNEKSFSIKRLILGKYEEVKYSPEWADKQIKGGKIIKKQEFVGKKEEVIRKIKSLFENFIEEYNDKQMNSE